MRRIAFLIFLIALIPRPLFAKGGIYCVKAPAEIECFTKVNASIWMTPSQAAFGDCQVRHDLDYCLKNRIIENTFEDHCVAVYANPQHQPSFAVAPSAQGAVIQASEWCKSQTPGADCRQIAVACDGAGIPLPQPPTTAQPQKVQPQIIRQVIYLSDSSLTAAVTGFSIALLLAFGFLFRQSVTNFVIHGRLPYELPAYAEDVRVVFKLTQRVNWYGRTIFGIVTNLVMTKDQLLQLRKYWLGRTVAFDSLRRQRQSELARLHLQLAVTANSEAKDKKPLSQLLAALKMIFFFLFYLARAVFSFLFGFLFIRVTIAKLARGTVIESKSLTLILQAKDAIEQAAAQLKEYLTTANTFDGRDEIHEP